MKKLILLCLFLVGCVATPVGPGGPVRVEGDSFFPIWKDADATVVATAKATSGPTPTGSTPPTLEPTVEPTTEPTLIPTVTLQPTIPASKYCPPAPRRSTVKYGIHAEKHAEVDRARYIIKNCRQSELEVYYSPSEDRFTFVAYDNITGRYCGQVVSRDGYEITTFIEDFINYWFDALRKRGYQNCGTYNKVEQVQ